MRAIMNRYNLKRQPFSKEVPADELFVSSGHEEIGARLEAAIEGHASAVLTGEVGVGKTFLLRALARDLNPSRYRVTYIHNANVSRRDFYRQLSSALACRSSRSLSQASHAHWPTLSGLMVPCAHLSERENEKTHWGPRSRLSGSLSWGWGLSPRGTET